MVFTFWGCVSYDEHVRKVPDSLIPAKVEELKNQLIMNGVSGEWFDKQIQHDTFRLHSNIDQYFQKSAEKQTDHEKKHDITWYFARLGVNAKNRKGENIYRRPHRAFQSRRSEAWNSQGIDRCHNRRRNQFCRSSSTR